ncbi:MAG: type II secretion system protein [Planctomycetota bacterium]|nr:type II secretion system protein [Planctomycetota bacterium]
MRHGFSLLELVITVVIIGLLAAIAIPRFSAGGIQDRAYDDAAKQFGHDLDSGVSLYILDYKRPPSSFYSWVALGEGTGGSHYVKLGSVRHNLADPAADVMVDSQTLRLQFKSGLVAQFHIDNQGNITATYTKP